MNVKDYVVLTGQLSESFEEQVSEYLEDGWELYGYPFTGTCDNDFVFCQAMIKRGEN